MSYETVDLKIENGVAEITLNRPERLNAWTAQFGDELREAILTDAAAPEVRAVLITGAGRGFSSGADLKEMLEQRAEGGEVPDVGEMLRTRYHPIIKGIRELPKPVVAAVNGPAVGIGCSLALAADLIWAAESAVFGLAFVNIGLVPDGGSTFLVPIAAGKASALEMALLGDPIPAEKALDWGLINRVVPDGDLMNEARDARGPAGPGPDALLRPVQAGPQQLPAQDHGRAARSGGRHPGRDGDQRGLHRGRHRLRPEAGPSFHR